MTKDSSAKKIYGLIGYPVEHSLSPVMHNAAFKHLNIDAEYRLFEVPPERLKEFLLDPNAKFEDMDGNSIRAGDVLGFNITIPHKVRTNEILGEKGVGLIENITVREEHYVFLSGAINTIKRESSKVNYYNTDAVGFMKSLDKDLGFNTECKNIIIFGCGGAGRAAVAGLTWKDTRIKKIYIYDTDQEATDSAKEHFDRFDFVKDKLEFIQEKQILNAIKECQLLVNASPVGMKEGDGSVIDKSLLHENLSVYDVVYNRQTQLIKDAESLPGRPVKNGLGMLLYQGAEAFKLWTGQKAPVEVMRKALIEATSK